MSKDYGSWSLAALKAELEKRNAKRTGKKAVLVQRLKDYDILFGDIVNNPDCSFKIQGPDSKLFLDLNTDVNLPELNKEDLDTFCAITEKESNTQACKMYDENFLETLRFAVDGNGNHYISSICHSEMRKNVSYNILIKYEEYAILETQCECAAGMGPHAQCKHVIAALYGILHFVKNKKYKVRSSCTSSLQTFHHPRGEYRGGPVRAEELKIREKDQHLKKIPMFDPRPTAADQKYVETFKSSCVNFAALQKNSMPITQVIKPAKKKAVFLDHDYMELTHEENFLKDLTLKPNKIKEIEKTTRDDQKKWRKERLRRIQSSNFGKVCKSNKNKRKLAQSLVKNIELQTPSINHGLKFEKKAITEFKKTTGLQVQQSGIIIHPELQYLACTPDGLVGEDATLEVKCPYSAAHLSISPEIIDYIELCEKSGEWKLNRHHDYFHQVQGQLLCSNRSHCYFCIFTFKDFCVIKIKRDDVYIETMKEKLKLLSKYL